MDVVFSSDTTLTNNCARTSLWWVHTHPHHLWFVYIHNCHYFFTYHLFNRRRICTVDNFKCLGFGNIQSHEKLTGNPKIVSHPKISQESLKQKIIIYTYIVNHIQGQWHIPISTHTEKPIFLEIYSCHMTCPTHIRPSCLMNNHHPNTLKLQL